MGNAVEMRWRTGVRRALIVLALAVLGACSSSGSGSGSGLAAGPKLGGTVTGLAGTGLVLHGSTGQDLTIAADGAFNFGGVSKGASYAVTVAHQPSAPTQVCTVLDGAGTVGDLDVQVAVVCFTRSFKVGVSVTGLAGRGLVLQVNGGSDLAVLADGSYTFSTPLPSGAPYAITVLTQPDGPAQTCTPSGGTGNVGGSDAVIPVACTTRTFTVGGTVSGLQGTGLVLRDNGGDDLAITSNGAFAFATPVASGAAYAVTIQAQPTGPAQECAVSGGAGTVGSAAVTSVVVTCPKAWNAPHLLETADGNAYNPRVAFDGSGNAISVWRQHDGTHYSVYANRYVVGSGWGAAQLVESFDGGDAEAPQLAVAPSGDAIAVWRQYDGARYAIWANRYAGGSWGTAGPIESGTAGAEGAQVAVDGSGNGLAVWQEGVNLLSRRVTAAGEWFAPEAVGSATAGILATPQLAIEAGGSAHVVWIYQDNVSWTRRDATTGWAAPAVIGVTSTDGYSSAPQIAVDPAGNAIAVWTRRAAASTRYDIFATRYTAGGSWGLPVHVEVDSVNSAYAPQIAMDVAGNGMAVWHQSDGARYNIKANRYDVAHGWAGVETLVETDDTGSAYDPQVAIDPAGQAFAVWRQWDGTRFSISSSRWTAGGWRAAELLEADQAGDAAGPRIAIDGAGNAIAVWHQSDGTRFNVWASRYQ